MDAYPDDALTRRVIGCIFQVHGTLGPGFLERVYRRALVIELRKQGLATQVEKEVFICYDGHRIGRHVVDLIVEGSLIVELKTAEGLGKAYYAQVRSYLKATNLHLGLLVNFAGARADIRRIERP